MQGDHCLAERTSRLEADLRNAQASHRGSQRDSFNRAVPLILPQVPAEFVWCFPLRGLILRLLQSDFNLDGGLSQMAIHPNQPLSKAHFEQRVSESSGFPCSALPVPVGFVDWATDTADLAPVHSFLKLALLGAAPGTQMLCSGRAH